jgi:hypothetical protein
VIAKEAGGVLRCSLGGDIGGRWLELPAWMFDRAACVSIRTASASYVACAALLALKQCLALVLASGPGASRPSPVPVSGAKGLPGINPGEPPMRRKDRPSTRHRLAAPQLDLFPPPHGMQSCPDLAWEKLPEDTRERLTKLMARLLLEHGRGDRDSAGGHRDV